MLAHWRFLAHLGLVVGAAVACSRTAFDDNGDRNGATTLGPGSPSDGASAPSPDAAQGTDGPASVSDAETGNCPPATHVSNGGCIPDDPGAALPSSASCLATGANTLWIEGDPDALIYEGTTTVVGGTWQARPWFNDPTESGAVFQIPPAGATPETPPWFIDFTLSFLPSFNQTIVPGQVYSPTIPSQDTLGPELPVLNVQQLYACDQSDGAFRVDAIRDSADGQTLLSTTVAFWLHCHGHKGILRGCIFYVH